MEATNMTYGGYGTSFDPARESHVREVCVQAAREWFRCPTAEAKADAMDEVMGVRSGFLRHLFERAEEEGVDPGEDLVWLLDALEEGGPDVPVKFLRVASESYGTSTRMPEWGSKEDRYFFFECVKARSGSLFECVKARSGSRSLGVDSGIGAACWLTEDWALRQDLPTALEGTAAIKEYFERWPSHEALREVLMPHIRAAGEELSKSSTFARCRWYQSKAFDLLGELING